MNSINANNILEFYPNPVTDGYLNLINSGNSTKSVEIFDVVGKKVLSQQTLLSRVDVSALNAGIYVLNVTADNQTRSSRFVVK